MSDFDYGREHGLWGDDGMPYAVKYERSSTYNTPKSTKANYFTRSEQKALQNGFEVIYDENAYNGRYFVKNGKKWIHNIDALKSQLRIRNDNVLAQNGYDVDAYYTCD